MELKKLRLSLDPYAGNSKDDEDLLNDQPKEGGDGSGRG